MNEWRKSTYSESGNCAELSIWRKSSYSESGNCIEVANGVQIRDSKDKNGPVLQFNAGEWDRFVSELRNTA